MHACLLVALTLVAQSPTTSSPSLAAQDSAASSDDVMAMFAKAAQRADSAKSFVAEYRATADGEAVVFTLSYQAPDRAHLQAELPGTSADTWIIDGQMSLRAQGDSGPMHADFDMAEALTPSAAFEQAAKDLFHDDDADDSELGPGPKFALGLAANASEATGVELKIALEWQPNRSHVLSWLDKSDEWADARRDGARLVRQVTPKASIAMSMETGFLEELQSKSTLRLSALRVDEELDSKAFAVPKPVAGSRDASGDMSRLFRVQGAQLRRNQVYRLAIRAAAAESVTDASWRGRVARAFDVCHEEALLLNFAKWIEQAQTTTDEFTDSWIEQPEAQKRDPDLRAQFSDAVSKRRTELEGVLEKLADRQLGSLSAPDWSKIDTGLLTSVLAIERAAALEAYERVMSKPLLAHFDERVRLALEGE